MYLFPRRLFMFAVIWTLLLAWTTKCAHRPIVPSDIALKGPPRLWEKHPMADLEFHSPLPPDTRSSFQAQKSVCFRQTPPLVRRSLLLQHAVCSHWRVRLRSLDYKEPLLSLHGSPSTIPLCTIELYRASLTLRRFVGLTSLLHKISVTVNRIAVSLM